MFIKKCPKCKRKKETNEFYFRGGKGPRANELVSWCKNCVSRRGKILWENNKNRNRHKRTESSKRWRLNNKQHIRNYYKKVYNKNNKQIVEYLKTHPCVDCGFSDLRALEFDHIKGKKKFTIARGKLNSWKRIFKEIEKCEVRCANCHRIKTVEETKSYRKYKAH